MSQNPEDEGRAAPDPAADQRSGAGDEDIVLEVAENEELQGGEGAGTGAPGEPVLPPVALSGDAPGGEVDPADSGGDGDSAPRGAKGSRVSRQTFRAAVIAGGGNRANISRAIGLNANTVAKRIAADPELNALYGDSRAEPPTKPPGNVEVMSRDEHTLPGRVSREIGHVDDEDLKMYWGALRASGVSEKRLEKLKSLSGLSRDWATHISLSLRGHHQSYDGQLHNLAEVADDIRERLKGTLAEDRTTIIPLNAEDYSYLAKVYAECVKEAGKGVNTMLELTEALVRIMAAAKGGAPGEKAQSGWGPMKKVRAAEAKS